MRKIKLTLAAATAALILTGCQQGGANNFVNPQTIGAVVGAIGGGVAGHQLNHKNGRYVGAAIGAIAGAAIGNYMNQQQRELQQLQSSGVTVDRINESTIRLDIQSEILFATNQSTVSPSFYPPLDRIAQVLKQYPNTIVHVYGFTDRSGSAAYNLQLSEQRAMNVAQYLSNQGINWQRFVVKGYGERGATGGQNNPADRRVSILIKAVDQNNPQAAYMPMY